MAEQKWEKVDPEMTPTHNFEETPELVGEYMGKRENVGKHSSTIYTFLVNKNPVGVWGSTVLDSRLANLEGNELVKIVYKGKAKGKDGTEYKDFEVFKSK